MSVNSDQGGVVNNLSRERSMEVILTTAVFPPGPLSTITRVDIFKYCPMAVLEIFGACWTGYSNAQTRYDYFAANCV